MVGAVLEDSHLSSTGHDTQSFHHGDSPRVVLFSRVKTGSHSSSYTLCRGGRRRWESTEIRDGLFVQALRGEDSFDPVKYLEVYSMRLARTADGGRGGGRSLRPSVGVNQKTTQSSQVSHSGDLVEEGHEGRVPGHGEVQGSIHQERGPGTLEKEKVSQLN